VPSFSPRTPTGLFRFAYVTDVALGITSTALLERTYVARTTNDAAQYLFRTEMKRKRMLLPLLFLSSLKQVC
jgi:hypothetical protein